MSIINNTWYRLIPKSERASTVHFPDIILFHLNQIQYSNLWASLEKSQYIYTNGYEIHATNWFMYAFQSLKGWFGFDNACRKEKVSYTLEKLAYYGYLKQFDQPDFGRFARYPLSDDVQACANAPVSEANSAKLQQTLIKNYFDNKSLICLKDFFSLEPDHCFGQSWLELDYPELVPQLDPQDNNLIQKVLDSLDKLKSKKFSSMNCLFIPNSKFAKFASEHFFSKTKDISPPARFSPQRLFWTDPRPGLLEKALKYYSEIAKEHPLVYIDHYLNKEDYKAAIELLAVLPEASTQLDYLFKIPEENRHEHLERDSLLATALAKHYIDQKKYTHIPALISDIESLDPNTAFILAVQQEKHSEALAIFKRASSGDIFEKTSKIALAKAFFQEGESLYEQGRNIRNRDHWEDAKQCYFQSYVAKKSAWQLHPCQSYQEEMYRHKRLYAQLLIDIDIDLNEPKTCEITKITKAVKQLRDCHPKQIDEIKRHEKALTKGLMRIADVLMEKILSDKFIEHHEDIINHREAQRPNINTLIETLNEVVTLLKGTQSRTGRFYLGKAYYMLADVQDYFKMDNPKIGIFYINAARLFPSNPFYLLNANRFATTNTEETRKRGQDLLEQMKYDDPSTFTFWLMERGLAEPHRTFVKEDIHKFNYQHLSSG